MPQAELRCNLGAMRLLTPVAAWPFDGRKILTVQIETFIAGTHSKHCHHDPEMLAGPL
jgi:hypothetical protein